MKVLVSKHRAIWETTRLVMDVPAGADVHEYVKANFDENAENLPPAEIEIEDGDEVENVDDEVEIFEARKDDRRIAIPAGTIAN